MTQSFSDFLASARLAWQQELKRLDVRYNLISWSRALAFLAGVGLTWWLFRVAPIPALFAGAAALVAFMYLLKIHSELARQREDLKRKLDLLLEEEEVLAWNWLHREAGDSWIDPDHEFSFDLDLFGRGSLFQYLHRHGTLIGGKRLAEWLRFPSLNVGDILDRQQAVKELAAMPEWQIQFQSLGEGAQLRRESSDTLLSWIKEPSEYLGKKHIRWMLQLLPAALILSLIGWSAPLIPALANVMGSWALPGWVPLGIFLLNLGISGKEMGPITRQQNLFARKSALLKTYAGLLQQIEAAQWRATWLSDRQKRLLKKDRRASEAIDQFGELLYRLDQRLNFAAAILLNGLWLWDIRYIYRLEAWKEDHREELPQWLDVVADLDAINGLARTAAARPELHFPELSEGAFFFHATQLGHLLLRPQSRVDNDVKWDKPGEFLIVTGANMAGKSTFLRTVGTNLILAQIGAPVCAQHLALVPIQMMTSIRATDSLTDHESFFYAELKRLKAVIDRLKAQPPLFIIVDEMLRGTNSRDKQEGSRRFIEQLIQLGGVGMIATHDLSLGALATDYPAYARNKRFEVDIQQEQLFFDYQLLDGISQNLNATFLMQRMGIMPKE